ncbi:cilia- and flagella-associated protein 68 [Strix aluco]|uniref:cilia- and flagella-associated protein 68 n=1 Tax=Strix aluco TaxID=111821 RepID=UPI003DA6712A
MPAARPALPHDVSSPDGDVIPRRPRPLWGPGGGAASCSSPPPRPSAPPLRRLLRAGAARASAGLPGAWAAAAPRQGPSAQGAGCGELWMVWDTTSKLHQYGCRCTTNENDYSTKTVMGNWNEERYDIQRIVQLKPLPSQDLKQNLLVSRPPP